MVEKRIAILAYACGPKMGSEFRLGWNLPRELARNGWRVTVFVGSANGELGEFGDLYEFVSNEHNLMEGIDDRTEYIFVKPSVLMNVINYFNLKLKLSWAFYVALDLWNKKAFHIARSDSNVYDITHHLGPIGYRVPGYLWKIKNVKHVWGPIGGAQLFPTELLFEPSLYDKIMYRMKNRLNKLNLNSRRVARAILNTDSFTFSTRSNLTIFNQKYNISGGIYSDQAMDNNPSDFFSGNGDFVFVGSIDTRKNIAFLCDLFSELNYNLHVVGDGPLLPEIRLKHRGDKNIKFYGRSERKNVLEIMRLCSIGIIPSLVEANTAVLYEYLENGCVVIANDRDGFSTELPTECLVENKDTVQMRLEWLVTLKKFAEFSEQDRYCLWRQSLKCKTWKDMADYYSSIYQQLLLK